MLASASVKLMERSENSPSATTALQEQTHIDIQFVE